MRAAAMAARFSREVLTDIRAAVPLGREAAARMGEALKIVPIPLIAAEAEDQVVARGQPGGGDHVHHVLDGQRARSRPASADFPSALASTTAMGKASV